jgi:signal transduction histidine kinase
MSTSDRFYHEDRTIGRRWDDWVIRDQNQRHRMLFNVGQIITSEMNLDLLFEIIMDETNRIMGTERSTVFLHDDKLGELWSLVATGLNRDEIRIPDGQGFAGWCFHNREPLVINDAYRDPRFCDEIDQRTGFRTRNILCIPLTNLGGQCIGALQTLNKLSGEFVDEDLNLLVSLSYYVAIALENAKLYEELKALDKAKERVINHLSHEMRTPLSIISGVLGNVSRKLNKGRTEGLEDLISRGHRNVNRLFDLQVKINDILNQKSVDEREKTIHIIEGALSLIEEAGDESDEHSTRQILKKISKRLEDLYRVPEIQREKIFLDGFLHELCDAAVSSMEGREIEIVREYNRKIHLHMDRNVLWKVCEGLLKNAIENTPDEGTIRVMAISGKDLIRIDFEDCGVGITPQNQKMIFGGFFHTQDTSMYASKRPYRFNAGGSGADLLRTKALSERLGFRVDFKSTRCAGLPGDKEPCPGRISDCRFVAGKTDCLASGGSTFSLTFPFGRP